LVLYSSFSGNPKDKSMRLPQKAIEDFKKIYKKEYGEDISDSEAEQMAFRFLSLFALIYRPLPPDIPNFQNKKSPAHSRADLKVVD